MTNHNTETHYVCPHCQKSVMERGTDGLTGNPRVSHLSCALKSMGRNETTNKETER